MNVILLQLYVVHMELCFYFCPLSNWHINFNCMEIAKIKAHLSIAQVLQYYHLHPDRNHLIACPFHQDDTPAAARILSRGDRYLLLLLNEAPTKAAHTLVRFTLKTTLVMCALPAAAKMEY